MSRDPNRMPYLASLDGIRAIAILAVLLFHIWPAALPGGFTGVDVFFVLSGFLITSIILHDLRGGGFSLKEFYLRRIQRLLPNALVTIIAVLLLWSLFMPPGAAVQPAWHGLWTLSNLSNVYVWRHLGGYWGTDAALAPLTHFWSLGVEEQFYLLFPGLLWAVSRFYPAGVRFSLTAAAVLSFAAYLYGIHTRPIATFYLLPTRGWELLLGAIVAACRTAARPHEPAISFRSGTKVREALGWTGLGMIFAGYLGIGEGTGLAGWVSLAPALGTVLVLLSVVDGGTRVARVLAAPFLVATGKISYSLYLWHWPLIILGKMYAEFYRLPPLAGVAAGGVGGIMLGWAAYWGVERPLRNRGPGRAWRLALIGAGFCAVVTCCSVIVARPPAVDPSHRFDPVAFYGELFDAGKTANSKHEWDLRHSDIYYPPQPPRPAEGWRTGGVVHLYGGGRPQIVVFGSSHALMYSRLIDDICREMKVSVAFLGVDAATPAFFETAVNENFSSPQEAHEFDETRRKWLREWQPEAVFAIDRWDQYVGKSESFKTKLQSFLRDTAPLARRILFVTQVPAAEQGEKVNLRGFINWRWSQLKSRPRLATDSNEPLRREAVAVAEAATADFYNLRVLRADLAFYEKDGSIRYAAGRKFFYEDNHHLSDVGTEEVRPLFEKAIAEAHTVYSALP